MTSKDRREQIVKLLKSSKVNLSLEDLSKILDTSIPTLYRDIKYLEAQKIIKRYHGGFEIIRSNITEKSFLYRRNENRVNKIAIAKEAQKLIKNKETIIIDASSTSYYLAEELKNYYDLELTIITNSLFIPIVLLTNKNYTVINVGGMLHREIGSYIKGDVKHILKDIRCLKFFTSTLAVSSNIGMMDKYGTDDTKIKKEFAEMAEETIFLVDSTKFQKNDSYNWYPIDKVKRIVTDNLLDKKMLNSLKRKGIKVDLAKLTDDLNDVDSMELILQGRGII